MLTTPPCRSSGPPADKPQEQGSDAMQVDVPKELTPRAQELIQELARTIEA